MQTKAESFLDQVQPTPLARGQDGVIRIAGTRVTLDTIATAFYEGATAEEIAQQYPSVSLADVYSVLGHILRHQQETDDYLRGRELHNLTVRQENEKRFDPSGIRQRLLARKVPKTK